MTGIRDEFRRDVRRDPDELEREADRARADIEHTLDALRGRLSPGELVDRALDMVRRNGGEFGGNLASQVRNNPVPTVLAGIGLAWLMASSRDSQASRVREDFAFKSGGRTMNERASSATHSARGALDAAKSAADRAAGAASRARAGVSSAARGAAAGARNTAHSVSAATRSGARSLRHGYDYASREQPLILAGLAVAAGALIGSLLPATRTEGRWLGETSRDVTQRLREEGKRAMEGTREATGSSTGNNRGEQAGDWMEPPRGGRDPDSGMLHSPRQQ